MLRTLALSLVCLTFLAVPVSAQSGRVEALAEAMRLDEVLEIMQIEGIDYGEEVGASLLDRRGGAGWSRTVARLYDPARMADVFYARFDAEMLQSEAEIDLAVDFFASERGARIIGLEISARRALLDEEIDEAAKRQLAQMRAEGAPRLEQLQRFVRINDLLEENVVGGLNSTFAFYMGLMESGAPGFDLDQGEVIADVWSQEQDIREELEEWLFAFLALAYRPLDDDDLEAYIAFSATHAGQRLNTALFAAFNAMFESISRELGYQAGLVLSAQDI